MDFKYLPVKRRRKGMLKPEGLISFHLLSEGECDQAMASRQEILLFAYCIKGSRDNELDANENQRQAAIKQFISRLESGADVEKDILMLSISATNWKEVTAEFIKHRKRLVGRDNGLKALIRVF